MISGFEIQQVIPETVVAVMACAILLIDQFAASRVRDLSLGLTLATLAAVCVLTGSDIHYHSTVVLNGMFVDDAFSNLVKFMIALLAIAVFAYSRIYSSDRGISGSEFYVLGLFGILGMMIMASADHLLVLYLGLELMSLCMYAMVAFQRDSSTATEAAMKYFVLGAIGSGSLLYGLSILYGLTGTLSISQLQLLIAGTGAAAEIPLIFALSFVIMALAFKLGAAPFHMWVPDVYHGAPTSTTIYLGTIPKIAAFAMLTRLLIDGLGGLGLIWQDMLIVIALLSIIIGNVLAIAQSNLKRMLAYSTIAHMGYMLLGVLSGGSGSHEGYSAALFYVLVYAVMSLGAFGLILISARKGQEKDLISDYSGLNARDPWLALALLVLMFSMAGIPPTVGFYAKLAVIQTLVDAGLVWVAVVAVIFAVVGAFYYLRVIKAVYFDELEERESPVAELGGMRAMVGLNALALIAVLPWVGDALAVCETAVLSLFIAS